MLNRVLVAVDYSPCSRAAFEQALDMARASHAVVDVLHVFRTPEFIPPELTVTTGSGNQSLTTLCRERAQEEMDALLAKTAPAGGVLGTARVEDGDPARVILERAKVGGYDLVVLGTHGRTGLHHLLLGSVAEKVVRHCAQPVLTVRLPDGQ